MSSVTESTEEAAYRVKGYCIENNHYKANSAFHFHKVEIKSLHEYIDFIEHLEYDIKNPVYFRGQRNANYVLQPYIFRGDCIKHEDTLIKEFERKFPEAFLDKHTKVEQLAFMQHYGLKTRLLDLSENPLAGLYFACAEPFKFPGGSEEKSWGEVSLFQEPEIDSVKHTADLKYRDSSTVSILSSIAFLPQEFTLAQLQMLFGEDNQLGYNPESIGLRDVLSCSVIAKLPQDNPRLKNQQGAFIVCTANSIEKITVNNGEGVCSRTPKEFMQDLEKMGCSDSDTSLAELKEYPDYSFLKNVSPWDIHFKKRSSYLKSNPTRHLQDDSFDLNRLLLKDRDGKRYVVLIPPEAKKDIKRQLEKIYITDDFIYPEMDSVSYMLNKIYS